MALVAEERKDNANSMPERFYSVRVSGRQQLQGCRRQKCETVWR